MHSAARLPTRGPRRLPGTRALRGLFPLHENLKSKHTVLTSDSLEQLQLQPCSMELCVGPTSPGLALTTDSTGSLQAIKGTEQMGWAPGMPCSLGVDLKPGHSPWKGPCGESTLASQPHSTTWPLLERLTVIEEKDVPL